jgi:hypothetical protein
MEKATLDFNRLSKYNALLHEDAEKLVSSNRSLVESIAKTKEELIEFEGYLMDVKEDPVSKPGTRRHALMEAEAERDSNQLRVLVSKQKLKIEQQRLATVEAKLAEMRTIVAEVATENQLMRTERQKTENDLRRIQTDRGELLCDRLFVLEQRKLLEQRILEQEDALVKIEKKTRRFEMIFQRQMFIREYNWHQTDLKNCNLGHAADLISAMLDLNGKIGGEIASSSSSNGQLGDTRK